MRRGHERVGLYLYSPSGPQWPVIGRNFTFTILHILTPNEEKFKKEKFIFRIFEEHFFYIWHQLWTSIRNKGDTRRKGILESIPLCLSAQCISWTHSVGGSSSSSGYAMTLLSAAIRSTSDAQLIIQIPTGNSVDHHNTNTCCYLQLFQETGQCWQVAEQTALNRTPHPLSIPWSFYSCCQLHTRS